MVVFDSTFLILLLYPDAKARTDPKTGAPVSLARQRVEGLITELQKKREVILVPAPVLGEILAHAGDALDSYRETLKASRAIRIVPFDERAAIESALLFGPGIQKGGKKGGAKGDWQKVKVDQQIVAIARVHGANVIYSNDEDMIALCKNAGIAVVGIQDVPVPRDALQTEMKLPSTSTPKR